MHQTPRTAMDSSSNYKRVKLNVGGKAHCAFKTSLSLSSQHEGCILAWLVACISYIARWFQGSCTYWMRQGYVCTYAKPSSLWQHRPPKKYYGVPKDEAIISPSWTWFYGINTMEDTLKKRTVSRSSNQTAQNHQREIDTDIEEQCQLLAHYWLSSSWITSSISLSHDAPFHLWATQHTQWCWRKKGVENCKLISYQLQQQKRTIVIVVVKKICLTLQEVSQNNLLRDAHDSQLSMKPVFKIRTNIDRYWAYLLEKTSSLTRCFFEE